MAGHLWRLAYRYPTVSALTAAATAIAFFAFIRKRFGEDREGSQPQEGEKKVSRHSHMDSHTHAPPASEALHTHSTPVVGAAVGVDAPLVDDVVVSITSTVDDMSSTPVVEVYESLPEGEETEIVEVEVATKVQDLRATISSIIEKQHKIVESDPAVVHPACVGYDFLGPAIDETVHFNAAHCTPVLVGVW